jgi:hypothetical protein
MWNVFVGADFRVLLLSLVATGIAPGSFYELDANGHRQRAHYDGLPVAFIAEAISTLGARIGGQERSDLGFETYHVMNPYDDGIGLDEYVDWLVDAGHPIERVAGDYTAWLQRFETAIRALPERQRQASLLPLLHNYQRPETPIRGSIAPTDRFRTAVQPGEHVGQVELASVGGVGKDHVAAEHRDRKTAQIVCLAQQHLAGPLAVVVAVGVAVVECSGRADHPNVGVLRELAGLDAGAHPDGRHEMYGFFLVVSAMRISSAVPVRWGRTAGCRAGRA